MLIPTAAAKCGSTCRGPRTDYRFRSAIGASDCRRTSILILATDWACGSSARCHRSCTRTCRCADTCRAPSFCCRFRCVRTREIAGKRKHNRFFVTLAVRGNDGDRISLLISNPIPSLTKNVWRCSLAVHSREYCVRLQGGYRSPIVTVAELDYEDFLFHRSISRHGLLIKP
jgi:hypothetical protein